MLDTGCSMLVRFYQGTRMEMRDKNPSTSERGTKETRNGIAAPCGLAMTTRKKTHSEKDQAEVEENQFSLNLSLSLGLFFADDR